MELINFSQCEQDYLRSYGGQAGRKIPIIYQEENYFLKLPGNLREKGMKNINLSYSNSPISEYIGSHIYEMVGVDVHKTLLGTYTVNGKEKIVCACRDFEQDGGKLHEFSSIKVSFYPAFTDSNGMETNGDGTDIQEVLNTIEEHPLLKEMPEIKARFWEMFVVDAFIGNSDRNNGNWGVLIYPDKSKKLAPVYDNGNCLNDKWDEAKMISCMEDSGKLKAQAYDARRCIYMYRGRAINPYHFIAGMEDQGCIQAVQRIFPRIKLREIGRLINEISCISNIQKRFYQTLLQKRYDDIFKPVYEMSRFPEKFNTFRRNKPCGFQ